jgi:phospholipase/lecithinase/hemolysin
MRTYLRSCLAVGLAISLPVAAASAKPFSALVEFSGALSDNGNFASVHGQDPAPFYQGRTTNGLTAGEVMAARLGLKADPSMHLIGKARGTNFAVRDALAGGNGPDDLPAQLDAYLKPRGGKADPDALYFVFIGGNDVLLAAVTPNDDASEAILRNAVSGIESGIRRLVSAGARQIFAPDFIDVSTAPAFRAAGPGAVARAGKLSAEYNQAFNAMLDRVEGELDFTLIRWSFDGFVRNVFQHADELGFTDTTDACTAMPRGQCDTSRFIFLNEQFPTAKVHELIGTALALAVVTRATPASEVTRLERGAQAATTRQSDKEEITQSH